MSLVFLNHRYLPMSEARIHPLDRGFLFGDGLYEVMRVENMKVYKVDYHCERITYSAKELGINLDINEKFFRNVALRLAEENRQETFGLYFQVSRGYSLNRGHAITKDQNMEPTLFATMVPSQSVTDCLEVFLMSKEDYRWGRCDIKATAILATTLEMTKAKNQGFDEVLWHTDGRVHECGAANVFAIDKAGALHTPKLSNKILPGVTRRRVLELAKKAGVKTVEGNITLDELKAMNEVWITSILRGIDYVSKIDDSVMPKLDRKNSTIAKLTDLLAKDIKSETV